MRADRVRRSLAALTSIAALSAALTPALPTFAQETVSDRAGTTPSDLTIKRVTTGRVVTGSKQTFSGTAPTRLHGQRAVLQRRVGKKGDWIKVDSARVSRKGHLTGSGVATGVGVNAWRWVMRTSGGKHTSKALTQRVYAWYYLSDLQSVDSDGGYPGSFTMGGKTYSKSVGGDGNTVTDWIEYNVSYHCAELSAWIGISDYSETGTTADFYVTVDGARSLLGSKGLGTPSHVTVDTSTRLRIRLEMDPTNNDGPRGYWAFGNAKVLCDRKP